MPDPHQLGRQAETIMMDERQFECTQTCKNILLNLVCVMNDGFTAYKM